MEVSSELETVVGSTDEISLAASVSIIVTTIPGTVTVTLSLIARVLRGAAPLTIVIPASTSLTWNTMSVLYNFDILLSDLQEAQGEHQQGSGAEAQG